MPTSRHALLLPRTYTCDAGSSPTSTTASPGVTPRARSAATSSRTSSRTFAEIALPSMSISLFSHPVASSTGTRIGRSALQDLGEGDAIDLDELDHRRARLVRGQVARQTLAQRRRPQRRRGRLLDGEP